VIEAVLESALFAHQKQIRRVGIGQPPWQLRPTWCRPPMCRKTPKARPASISTGKPVAATMLHKAR
jgi:hypothetical protein